MDTEKTNLENENPALSKVAVSGGFICALGKEKPCKEQCFTCSEDEKCDNENLSDKCPMCKSDNLLDVDDNWTTCCDCGFSFVG